MYWLAASLLVMKMNKWVYQRPHVLLDILTRQLNLIYTNKLTSRKIYQTIKIDIKRFQTEISQFIESKSIGKKYEKKENTYMNKNNNNLINYKITFLYEIYIMHQFTSRIIPWNASTVASKPIQYKCDSWNIPFLHFALIIHQTF